MLALNRIVLTILSFLSFSSLTVAQTPCHPDFDALIAFYNATNGANWTTNAGWVNGAAGTDCNPCFWYGLSCDATTNRVTSIQLPNNNLVGMLPSEIGDLSFLSTLLLNSNQLTGNIPPELGNLSELIGIAITNNLFSGSIPPELGNLSNLQIMLFGDNNLSGNIPPELGNLNSATLILIARNQLTGEIPVELGNLTSLLQLNLSWNQLTGNIPSELGMTSINNLTLNDNLLTGKIPSTLGNLSMLFNLQLYNNNLDGNIPPELGYLSNLTTLQLNDNQLEGCFPSSLLNHCGITTDFTNNTGLPGNGNFPTFCASNTGICAMELDLKIMLGGAFENSTGTMRTDLNQANLIPMSSGSNTITETYLLDAMGSNAIVDWVTVEVRETNTLSTVVAQQNALLQSDGDIVDADGRTLVIFEMLPAGNYHVAIRHRNHLGAMSAGTVTVN